MEFKEILEINLNKMITIKEEKIAELMFDIWHKSNDLKNPVMVGEYIAEKLTKVKNLAIHDVMFSEAELPDQKEIIAKGMELAKQGKLKNDKASIKDYLFGFIDGFRYTKQKIEAKGN